MNIYVSNLSFDMQDGGLKDCFIGYGEVTSARIIVDKVTEKSRGFGFVEMSDDEAAKKAIAELNGSTVGGRAINVSEAKSKPGRDFSAPSEKNFNNPKSYNQTRY